MNLKTSYEAKDIEVLEGLEPVRKRPGMYIGGTDDKAIHHLALEIIDNSMDEAIAGHADLIKISLIEHSTLQIEDNGRGIPIDDHPKFPGKSALEIIVSTLHAGGKFSNGAYETSGGLHGVGISVVNALSENLEVTVVRNKKIYSQKYSRGIVQSNLEYIGKTTKKSGTIVKFTPDPEIFGANFSFSSDKLFKECQSKAYLLSRVKIEWNCKKELVKNEHISTHEIFCYPNGMIDYLNANISSDYLFNKIHFTGNVKLKEKNKTRGLILSIDDVTELVEAQKHAAWSNVARYIAHEIKNPLTPIKLSAQRLEKFLINKNNQSLTDCTETIKRQVNNIQNLVTEFSNFARMPDSKFKNQRLNEIIESQINSLKILDENIIIEYNNEVKDIKLKCDYNQLSRVFLNILKNSYESQTKNKKFISVKVTDGIDFIDINIEDSGDGFPENRDKLFEPYITNKIDGTGLGLAICKKIIEDHGGEIYLLNSNDFGGASVRIKLYKV